MKCEEGDILRVPSLSYACTGHWNRFESAVNWLLRFASGVLLKDYPTNLDSRVNCLAPACSAVFDRGVQLVSGSLSPANLVQWCALARRRGSSAYPKR